VQLGQLQEIEPQLLTLGYRIIAVGMDRPEKLRETLQKHGMNYLLLSDSDAVLARALGLAFRVDETTLEKYRKYGIDLEEAAGRPHHILPVPAAYVIDTAGVIQFSYANPDHTQRVRPAVLLAAAQDVAAEAAGASVRVGEAKP
jgi:peroxiredoxin